MKQFLITVAGVLVAFVIFFIGLPIMVISALVSSAKPEVPSAEVLSLDLREAIRDQDKNDPLEIFSWRNYQYEVRDSTVRSTGRWTGSWGSLISTFAIMETPTRSG